MKNKIALCSLAFALLTLIFAGCNSGGKQTNESETKDSVTNFTKDSSISTPAKDTTGKSGVVQPNKELPKVFVYNFHVTNRCASCIAIEDATTKTLNTYFAKEIKQGRIKRQILNVDDEANAKISEKYQVFGSGIFVTQVYKGKETIADLTGNGFKFARNKEERFIEILKNKIDEFLK